MVSPDSSAANATGLPIIEKTAGSKAFKKGMVYDFGAPLSRPLRQQLRRVAEVASVMALDLLALSAVFTLAYMVRVYLLPNLSTAFSPAIPDGLMVHLWWLPLVVVGCLAYDGLYVKRHFFWRECGSLVKAVTLSYLIAAAVVTLEKTSSEVSRTFLVLSWIFSLILLPAFRYAGKNALVRAGIWRRRVLVLGAGKTGELVVRALNREPYMGYQVVGLLEDDPGKKNKTFTINGGTKVTVLGGFRDSDKIMARTGVYNLIVAAPGLTGQVLVGLVNRLQRVCESVLVVPDFFGMPVMGVEADYFFNDSFLGLRLKNNLADKTNIFLKRVFDLVAGSLIMIPVLPLMALIALAVKIDSPGPAIFVDRRIGRKTKEFCCYKFRTMYINNEEIFASYLSKNPETRAEWEKYAKLKGKDPRVTRVGAILRKLSLDELPQIFNVLVGQMSLVGPRPYLPREKENMGNYIGTILMARPGITGLWQVSGRSHIDFKGRLLMDTWYVRNWSLWMDVTLLIRTVAVVLGRKGAY